MNLGHLRIAIWRGPNTPCRHPPGASSRNFRDGILVRRRIFHHGVCGPSYGPLGFAFVAMVIEGRSLSGSWSAYAEGRCRLQKCRLNRSPSGLLEPAPRIGGARSPMLLPTVGSGLSAIKMGRS